MATAGSAWPEQRGERMAQDDYYYEIQLTNKQLVFYFMAAATGLILSFLAGVMVGSKTVEGSANELQAARPPAAEDRIVAEDAPAARPSAVPSAQDLTYAQRLESEKVDDSLERGKESGGAPARGAGKPAPAGKTPASPAPAATASPAPKAAAAKTPATPAPKPSASPAPEAATKTAVATPPPVSASAVATAPSSKVAGTEKHAPNTAPGTFYVQVIALKDKAAAERIVAQLKQKNFAAYGTEGPDGFFNVRVGSYTARADAEQTQTKLRDPKYKFSPFIGKN